MCSCWLYVEIMHHKFLSCVTAFKCTARIIILGKWSVHACAHVITVLGLSVCLSVCPTHQLAMRAHVDAVVHVHPLQGQAPTVPKSYPMQPLLSTLEEQMGVQHSTAAYCCQQCASNWLCRQVYRMGPVAQMTYQLVCGGSFFLLCCL